MADGHENKKSPSVGEFENALEHLHKAEAELEAARDLERKAEHDIEEAIEELKEAEHHHDKSEDLIVNKVRQTWPKHKISGSEIKVLAGSPTDWVVNQITDQPGDDPEIADGQFVDLRHNAPPEGIKRFKTRKPKTSPGHD